MPMHIQVQHHLFNITNNKYTCFIQSKQIITCVFPLNLFKILHFEPCWKIFFLCLFIFPKLTMFAIVYIFLQKDPSRFRNKNTTFSPNYIMKYNIICLPFSIYKFSSHQPVCLFFANFSRFYGVLQKAFLFDFSLYKISLNTNLPFSWPSDKNIPFIYKIDNFNK